MWDIAKGSCSLWKSGWTGPEAAFEEQDEAK